VEANVLASPALAKAVERWSLIRICGDDEELAMNTSARIDVNTTKLYHEVCGSGPTVLLISGATGDAGDWGAVAPMLAQDFTVVTYDRRGCSRSPRPSGWTTTSMIEQADDAAALLRALDLAPALVVGHSSGGTIACCLVARHPEVVRHAVIYEPPLFAVVPDGEKIAAGLQALASGGPRRGMEQFMRANAGDEMFKAFQSLDPTTVERILDNGTVFFPIELPVCATFVPDRERMRASGVPLTVVVGNDSRDSWFDAAATWLVEGTGADRVELPGGHVGFVSHPQEFVELVRRIARRDSIAVAPSG
jgi:pimeloyl-ACP methyl ester carboxylesterase